MYSLDPYWEHTIYKVLSAGNTLVNKAPYPPPPPPIALTFLRGIQGGDCGEVDRESFSKEVAFQLRPEVGWPKGSQSAVKHFKQRKQQEHSQASSRKRNVLTFLHSRILETVVCCLRCFSQRSVLWNRFLVVWHIYFFREVAEWCRIFWEPWGKALSPGLSHSTGRSAGSLCGCRLHFSSRLTAD